MFVILIVLLSVNAVLERRFAFIHIAKTGGTSGARVLPILTKTRNCNIVRKIPKCCCNATYIRNELAGTQLFGDDCSFFTFEWTRFEMRDFLTSLGVLDATYMSMLRNPVLHWLSAFQHQYKNSKVGTLEEYLGAAVSDEPKPSTLYNLHNFQLNHFARNSSVKEGFDFLRSQVFWFGLLEEIELSYALLMCLLFDDPRSKVVQRYSVGEYHKNKAAVFNYTISAEIMSRLTKQNRGEMRFYGLAVGEFWDRVRRQRKCLLNGGFFVPSE